MMVKKQLLDLSTRTSNIKEDINLMAEDVTNDSSKGNILIFKKD